MRGQWHVVSVRRWLHAHRVVDVVLHCGRVVVCIVCRLFNNWSRVAGVLPSAGAGSPGVFYVFMKLEAAKASVSLQSTE